MPTNYYWDTQPIIVTRSGTNWTVDTTLNQLDQDLSILDFEVLFDDIPTSQANFTKTTAELLTYTGPSIPSTTVEVRRLTPTAPRQLVEYQQRFSSADYNRSLERLARQIAEFRALGVGVGSNQINVNDADYGVGWDGDVSNAPSRNTVYQKLESVKVAYEAADTALSEAIALRAPLVSPALTGTPTAPTASTDTSNTQIATTQYVRANRTASELATQGLLDAKAPLVSPALTGTPTAPTAAAGTDTTQLATTAHVLDVTRDAWESVTPTFSNSHTNAVLNPITPLVRRNQYTKMGFLQANLARATSLAPNSPCLNLPAGYRPPVKLWVPVYLAASTSSFDLVSIDTNGDVTYLNLNSASGALTQLLLTIFYPLA